MSLESLAFTREQGEVVGKNPEEVKYTKKEADKRFFRPGVKDTRKHDDTRPDEYQVLIRILPRGRDYSKPYSNDVYEHFFKANGKTFYSMCRKTLGLKEECPVCDNKWELWNVGKAQNNEVLKKSAMDRKEKLKRICNIYIVKDLVNPDNNGKVMLWKMPNTIANMITEAIDKSKRPKTENAFDDEGTQGYPEFYPQDPVNGRHLALVIRRDPKNNVTSYEASKWYKPENPLPVAKTEEEILTILDKCNDLTEFSAEVPSVEALNAKLAAFNSSSAESAAMSSEFGSVSDVQRLGDNPFGNTNTAPVSKAELSPTKVDPDYFKEQARSVNMPSPVNPLPQTPVESVQPTGVELDDSDDGDEELPF